VFRFHVSKTHSIWRNICDKSRVFVFAMKSIWFYFQREVWKRTLTANRSILCSLWRNIKWHDCLRFLHSLVHRNWTNVGRGHHFSSFILNDSTLWIAFSNFSLLSIHPSRSTKAKNIKGGSIRKDHKTVKVKQKILYVKVTTLYKSVSFVEQNKSYKK